MRGGLVTRVLAKAGYCVTTAGDGEAALQAAIDHSPDLILLDMLLPKLSGPEVLHALKKHSKTADVPVIVLSSLSQKNEDRLKEDGATAYFEKSRMDPAQDCQPLLDLIRATLQRSARRTGGES